MSKSRLSRLDADLDRVESMSSRLLPHTLLALALCGLFWLLPDSLEHYALALAVFALAAQSALSLSSPEAGGGLRSEYLHYLASLLGPAGLASVGVLGFLMIFLPTASLPSLAGLAYLAAAVFALLALIRADRPREETVHPPLDPATIVALLLSAGFVSAYAWRFVLVPMQASYASGVSLLAGLAFLILWVGIFALKSAASRRQASVPGYARRVRSGTLRHLWHAGLSLAGGTVFILLVARESL